MSTTIKILIIDDHQIFRDGISSMFNEEDDILVVGYASDGEEALTRIEQLDPDILLLDISLPKITGLDLLKIVSEKYLGVRTLVLSMYSKDEYVYRAMTAGAYGYLLKQNTSKDELLMAIRTVFGGAKYLNDEVSLVMKKSHSIKSTMSDEFQRNISTLTKRELEIVRLVAEGLTNQEMASKLFVNIRTIETHKTNILQKLQLKNSVDLVKYAIQNNLLEL